MKIPLARIQNGTNNTSTPDNWRRLRGVKSMLGPIARGTNNPTAGASLSKLTHTPAIGQWSGVAGNGMPETRLVTGGAIFTGRKLDTTP